MSSRVVLSVGDMSEGEVIEPLMEICSGTVEREIKRENYQRFKFVVKKDKDKAVKRVNYYLTKGWKIFHLNKFLNYIFLYVLDPK